MSKNKSTIHIAEKEVLISFVQSRSLEMADYIASKNQSTFTLWSKNLTHSDLTNRGKRNGMNEGLSKNYLYYLSEEEMQIVESNATKPFESAKQSNIGFPEEFYEDINLPRLQRRDGPQLTQHEHIKLNDYFDVFLVNDTIKYFTMDYSQKVFNALNKNVCWTESVELSNGLFTPIELTQAIHGLGTSKDAEFHKLRLSMFLNDTITIVFEKNNNGNNMFIMLEKNPRFFTIIGESNIAWEKYVTMLKEKERGHITIESGIATQEEKTRKQQSAWKELLAKEMMNYTTHEGEVFCPLTQINADFNDLSMLFIASHIKRYADSSNAEAFDVNNGLLLCANADALFDKYMITIDENKKLKFSFLLDNNFQLKQKLQLNQPIFDLILNDQRMLFMSEHRAIFEAKELKRKGA